MAYTQLSLEERHYIQTQHQLGILQNKMVIALRRHQSNIGRELGRNTGQRGYRYKQADGMEIVGEFMGKGHDKGIWRYFRNHWHGWFPHLGLRANFARQDANLWGLKRRIQDCIAWQTGAMDGPTHLVDGFPMSACKHARASGSVCRPTDVKQTLSGNRHRAIERTSPYRKSPGTRHLAFG